MENDEKEFIRCGLFIPGVLGRKRRLSTPLQVCLTVSFFSVLSCKTKAEVEVAWSSVALSTFTRFSLNLKKKLLFPIRARSPLICQFSNSSVHEYLKFEIAEYKKVSYGSEIVFRRTLVQKHFFTRNWQKPPVADAGTRHFANCFLMAKSASLWSLKAPEQKVICAVESNWFPIVLGAGNGTGTLSFCEAFIVDVYTLSGDYWIMICVPIFVNGRERDTLEQMIFW